MDYEREDKIALCRATLTIAKEDATKDGATRAGTAGGIIPLDELLSSSVPWARGGWIYQSGDPHGRNDGRVGSIVEAVGYVAASFPVYR